MYERVGGDAWFVALVDRFYAGVADDPVLRPLYPDDLGPVEGPPDRVPDPVLGRARRPTARSGATRGCACATRRSPSARPSATRGSRHMAAAVRAGGLSDEDEAALLAYFDMAATHMINAPS